MAGFLVTPCIRSEEQLTNIKEILTSGGEQLKTFDESNLLVVDSYFETLDLYAPAYDPISHTTVLCFGRPTLSEASYHKAANEFKYRYLGGVANQVTLHKYLEYGMAKVLQDYSGGATTLIFNDKHLYVIADVMGYTPAFVYQATDIKRFIVSSSPKAISQLVPLTTDYISLSEFLHSHKCTPPFTFHKELRALEPATVQHWDFSKDTYSKHEYWTFPSSNPFNNYEEAVEATTQAVRESIEERTWMGNIVTYTSGGLDSRLVLYTATNPSKVDALNMYDTPNWESRIAKALCKDSGTKYIGWQRDKDYYPHWLEKGVLASEGMWSMYDNHFQGTKDHVMNNLKADVVISSCSVDVLFKEAQLDRRRPKLLGKELSWLELSSKWNGGYIDPPKEPLPTSVFREEIQERLHNHFGNIPDRLLGDEIHAHIADKRVRPLCYAPGLCFTLWYRILPYDNFMADKRMVNCYAAVRPTWRVNKTLWKQVVVNLCGENVINANTRLKPSSNALDHMILRVKNALKKIGKPKNTKLSLNTDGSWPNFMWYVNNSPTIKALWDSITPDESLLITKLFGDDSWIHPLNQWTPKENRILFKILNIIIYLRQY